MRVLYDRVITAYNALGKLALPFEYDPKKKRPKKGIIFHTDDMKEPYFNSAIRLFDGNIEGGELKTVRDIAIGMRDVLLKKAKRALAETD